jgi:hypothetical protein
MKALPGGDPRGGVRRSIRGRPDEQVDDVLAALVDESRYRATVDVIEPTAFRLLPGIGPS